MLVRGKRESRSSRTTSVRVRREGSMRVNFFMCPGNHDVGEGKAGITKFDKAIVKRVLGSLFGNLDLECEAPRS
jgi:hypothetical protein